MNSNNSLQIFDTIIQFHNDFYIDEKYSKSVIIIDENVFNYNNDLFSDFETIVIPSGESNKNISTVNSIITKLVDFGVDRHSHILAVGGGVLCDIAAFVSSIYMRGINFTLVPSTLLAMVDASIGGKTGVNHNSYKNMIGTFSQPNEVLIFSSILNTLSKDEFKNGIAEIIKIALVNDKSLFDELIESNFHKIDYDKQQYKSEITNIISKSIQNKISIVQKDERESGIRKLLNFGHTFGHAIERENEIPHGQAVAIGIVIASKISHKLGYISKEKVEIITNTIERFGLSSNIELTDSIFNSLTKDKKKNKDSIDFILLENIGKGIVKSIKINELRELAL